MPQRLRAPAKFGRAVDGVLHISVAGHPDFTVLHCRDLTLEGIELETEAPVPPRATMTLDCSYGDALHVIVKATCVHCRLVRGNHDHRYASTWEFIIAGDETVTAVASLMTCLSAYRR